MEPIHVLRPPREAFNKNRPLSDLIRSQVEHFRHVEAKLSDAQRRTLPQGHIRTEHEAAQYISAMTQLLQSMSAPAVQPLPAPIIMPTRSAPRPGRGLAIAAAEEPLPATLKPSKKTTPRLQKTKKGKKK